MAAKRSKTSKDDSKVVSGLTKEQKSERKQHFKGLKSKDGLKKIEALQYGQEHPEFLRDTAGALALVAGFLSKPKVRTRVTTIILKSNIICVCR